MPLLKTPQLNSIPMAIKYVAAKGGGTLLINYITFLQVLCRSSLFASVEHYAGTSAGAILCSLLAVGYTPDELYKILATFDFTQLEDGHGFIGEVEGILSSRHGLNRGKWFENWVDGLISDKLGKPAATFRDLKAAGRPDLSVVTTYINEGDSVICNYTSTPDVIIAEAVRASMSIPIYFDLFSFTQGFQPEQQFEDGGVLLNYPINLFDGYPEEEVLGLYLHDVSNVQPPAKIHGLCSLAMANFEAIMSASDSWLFPNEKWMRQTMIIDTEGQSSTNFSPSPADIAIRERTGTEAGQKYLQGLRAKDIIKR